MKFVLALIILLPCIVHGQRVTDRLNFPGPVQINGKSHVLSWSSNPASGFYKQEYIPAGDNPVKFNSMVLVDVSITNKTVKDAVGSKVAELQKMKETNPLVYYDMFQKNDEYLLDFLLSAASADGKRVDMVERNVYRYRPFTDKSGKNGILLFAVSVRGYGNDVDAFLIHQKTNRTKLLSEVTKFNIPAITTLQ